ncbi:MAG: hypothetical protein Q9213_006681 [Squamulea squamosa]
MATSQGHHTTSSSLDTLDMDQYINYEPSPILPSSSLTPESSQSKNIPAAREPIDYANSLLLSPTNQQIFAGPSHQYELHKQQTGLPAGALANTLAVNQNDHIVYGQAQRMFGIPSADAYFGTNTTDDVFDFNTAPSQTLGSDMDIDFATSIQDANADYIDPSAVGGEESSSFNSIAPKQRAWPGMHQQQAAIAKAQAEAQQQRQQTLSQQQSSRPASRPASQRPTSISAPAKDPIVEERISRLLNQMRHSSVTSSTDDAPTPTAQGNVSHLGRAKKDEEDMDEDERLLASEEGKKLSSKERRQLRNKVSARAFRSRRKEYIGQLEGEIAAKTAEADELRAKNQALTSENARLTEFSRMLLESPAFLAFLEEISGTEKPSLPQPQKEATAPKIEEPQPKRPKDVNPHQLSPQVQSEQNDAQIGMALMPEPYMNFQTGNTAWPESVDFGLYNAQVYAVTSMPEGPAVDHFGAGLLSGKPTDRPMCFATDENKQEMPVIEYPSTPFPQSTSLKHFAPCAEEVHSRLEESDPAFALYDDEVPEPSKFAVLDSEHTLFSSTLLEKSLDRFELTIVDNGLEENGKVDAAALKKFKQLCAMMEAASQRNHSITAITYTLVKTPRVRRTVLFRPSTVDTQQPRLPKGVMKHGGYILPEKIDSVAQESAKAGERNNFRSKAALDRLYTLIGIRPCSKSLCTGDTRVFRATDSSPLRSTDPKMVVQRLANSLTLLAYV